MSLNKPCIGAVLTLFLVVASAAAEDYWRAGDRVEVHFFGEWTTGTIEKIDDPWIEVRIDQPKPGWETHRATSNHLRELGWRPYQRGERVEVRQGLEWRMGRVVSADEHFVEVMYDDPKARPRQSKAITTFVRRPRADWEGKKPPESDRPIDAGNAKQPEQAEVTYETGQRVEALAGAEWSPARVVAVEKGMIKVRFDDVKIQPAEWLLPAQSVQVAASGTPMAGAEASAPTPAAQPEPQAPPLPEGDAAVGKVVVLESEAAWKPLPPGAPEKPINPAPAIALRGIGAKDSYNYHDHVSSLLFPRGASVGGLIWENTFRKGGVTLERVDLRGRTQGAVQLPLTGVQYRLSPTGEAIAILTNEGDFHRPRYALRRFKIAGGKAEAAGAFLLPEMGREIDLWMLDDNHAITGGDNSVTLWSLGDGKGVWTLTLVKSGAAAQLSSDGALLAIADAGAVHVLDAKTGDVLAGGGRGVPDGARVLLNPDRTRAIAFSQGRILFFDAQTGAVTGETAMPQYGKDLAWIPDFNARHTWLDERFVVVGMRHIIDAQRCFTAAQRAMTVQAGDAVAHGRAWSTDAKQLKLTSRRLLTPQLVAQIDKIDPATVWALQPGDAVALQVNTGDTTADEQARQAIARSLQNAGYVAAASGAPGKATVTANVRRENGEAVEYRPIALARGGPEMVTPRIVIYDMQLRLGDQVLQEWSTRQSFGNFGIEHPPAGKTIQQIVDERAKVSGGIFGDFVIPGRFPKRECLNGVIDAPWEQDQAGPARP